MAKHIKKVTKRIPYDAQGASLFYPLVITAGWLLMNIDVFLKGTITFANGTTPGAAQGEVPGGLVGSLEIDADPIGAYFGGKLKRLSPRSILRGGVFDTGRFLNDTNTAIAGAATSYTVNLRLPLRFALPYLLKPVETALRLDQFSQVLLTINNGTIANMLPGNDRDVDVSGLYYEVVEYREFAGPDGKYMPLATLYEDDRYITIDAASPAMAIDSQLSKSESYLDLMLITETTGQVPSTAILNKVEIFEDVSEWDVRYPTDIHEENREYCTETADEALTGVYYLPIAQGYPGNKGMMLSGAVDNINLRLDVNKPGTDRLLVRTRRARAAARK